MLNSINVIALTSGHAFIVPSNWIKLIGDKAGDYFKRNFQFVNAYLHNMYVLSCFEADDTLAKLCVADSKQIFNGTKAQNS